MRCAAVLLGLLLVLPLGCGPRSAERPACLDAPAPPPDGAWVRAARRTEHGFELELAEGGRRLSVPAGPRAIVSTLPGLTETLLWLGAGDRLVAATAHCRLPPELAQLPRIAVMPLSREMLVSLEPDLVVVDGILLPQAETELDRLGLSVLPVQSRSLAHWRKTVEVLATVLDTEKARRRLARFTEDLDAATDETARRIRTNPRVLLLADIDPLHVLGPGSLLDDMVRQCGAINVACDLGRASGPFSEELVLARRPDVVLLLAGALPPSLRGRWASVPAVANGRLALCSEDRYLQAGPDVPAVLRDLADAIHGGER